MVHKHLDLNILILFFILLQIPYHGRGMNRNQSLLRPGPVSCLYSCSLFRRVRTLIPKIVAAWVRFPSVLPKALKIRSFSTSRREKVGEPSICTTLAGGSESSRQKSFISIVGPEAISTVRSKRFSNSRTFPRHSRCLIQFKA